MIFSYIVQMQRVSGRMVHIGEHILELYVLGAREVEGRKPEIEAHSDECAGCKTLTEMITLFYQETEVEYVLQAASAESPESILLKIRAKLKHRFDACSPPLSRVPVRRHKNT